MPIVPDFLLFAALQSGRIDETLKRTWLGNCQCAESPGTYDSEQQRQHGQSDTERVSSLHFSSSEPWQALPFPQVDTYGTGESVRGKLSGRAMIYLGRHKGLCRFINFLSLGLRLMPYGRSKIVSRHWEAYSRPDATRSNRFVSPFKTTVGGRWKSMEMELTFWWL